MFVYVYHFDILNCCMNSAKRGSRYIMCPFYASKVCQCIKKYFVATVALYVYKFSNNRFQDGTLIEHDPLYTTKNRLEIKRL